MSFPGQKSLWDDDISSATDRSNGRLRLRRRALRSLSALGLLVLCTASCQYLQNEFFTLDRAKPQLETDDRAVQPW